MLSGLLTGAQRWQCLPLGTSRPAGLRSSAVWALPQAAGTWCGGGGGGLPGPLPCPPDLSEEPGSDSVAGSFWRDGGGGASLREIEPQGRQVPPVGARWALWACVACIQPAQKCGLGRRRRHPAGVASHKQACGGSRTWPVSAPSLVRRRPEPPPPHQDESLVSRPWRSPAVHSVSTRHGAQAPSTPGRGFLGGGSQLFPLRSLTRPASGAGVGLGSPMESGLGAGVRPTVSGESCLL